MSQRKENFNLSSPITTKSNNKQFSFSRQDSIVNESEDIKLEILQKLCKKSKLSSQDLIKMKELSKHIKYLHDFQDQPGVLEQFLNGLQFEFFEEGRSILKQGHHIEKLFLIYKGKVIQNLFQDERTSKGRSQRGQHVQKYNNFSQYIQNSFNQQSSQKQGKIRTEESLDQISQFQNENEIIYRDGDHFGGEEWNEKYGKHCSLIAGEDSFILWVDQKVQETFKKNYADEKNNYQIILLRKIPIFSDSSDNVLRQINSSSIKIKFQRGDYIYHEGQESNHGYVILEGEFVLTKNLPHQQQSNIVQESDKYDQEVLKYKIKKKVIKQEFILRIYSKNELFGEQEIINNTIRKENVKCSSYEGELLVIQSKSVVLNFIQDKVNICKGLEMEQIKSKQTQYQDQEDKIQKTFQNINEQNRIEEAKKLLEKQMQQNKNSNRIGKSQIGLSIQNKNEEISEQQQNIIKPITYHQAKEKIEKVFPLEKNLDPLDFPCNEAYLKLKQENINSPLFKFSEDNKIIDKFELYNYKIDRRPDQKTLQIQSEMFNLFREKAEDRIKLFNEKNTSQQQKKNKLNENDDSYQIKENFQSKSSCFSRNQKLHNRVNSEQSLKKPPLTAQSLQQKQLNKIQVFNFNSFKTKQEASNNSSKSFKPSFFHTRQQSQYSLFQKDAKILQQNNRLETESIKQFNDQVILEDQIKNNSLYNAKTSFKILKRNNSSHFAQNKNNQFQFNLSTQESRQDENNLITIKSITEICSNPQDTVLIPFNYDKKTPFSLNSNPQIQNRLKRKFFKFENNKNN